MGTTNMLLREILQEIRDVKTHGIPQKVVSLSSPTGPIRNGWAVAEPAMKGPHKGKPRWYKADAEEYTYDFPALSSLASPSAVASAGGGGEEDENENCPAESFTGPPQLPNATRNTHLMGRMTKEEIVGLSKEDKKRRCELKKIASEERKVSRPPEEQAKIDARVAAMQAGRVKSKAYAGGGVLSAKNMLSQLASASPSEREEIRSLLSVKKAPTKVIANDLVFNPVLDCYVDQEGKCFYADLDETTLEPIPNKSRIVGKLRPGVNGDQAQESNFIAAKANSRKRKNRRNRTRKN